MALAGRHDTGERIALASFVAMSLLAGGSGVAIRFSNRELAPLWGAALRFLLAAGLLLAIMAALRLALPRGRALLGAVLYGALTFGAAFGLAYYALAHVHAGLGQTLLALVPLATVLLAAAQGQERLRARAVVGGLVALTGIAVMSGPASGEVPPFLAIGALIASAICFAEAAVLVRRFPPVHPVAMNAIGMTTGAVLLSAASILAGEEVALPSGTETWIAVGYLVAVGSVAVFVLYLVVLRHWTASRASYEFVLIPFVTLALSAWLDAEPIGAGLVVGGLFVLAGVYVGSLRRLAPNRKRAADAARAASVRAGLTAGSGSPRRRGAHGQEQGTSMRTQRRGHRLRWPLALLAAAAVSLLLPSLAWARVFMQGPSVRVTPNTEVEFKWTTDVTRFGQIAIYDNPDGAGNAVLVPQDEDAGGNPVAATEHTIVANVGTRLATDTGYFFRVTATDPTGVDIPFSTPTPLPPFFTGAQAIGNLSVEPAADGAVISWDANVIGLGRVEYGETASYGQTVDDSDNVTDHSLALTGLAPGTTYHFLVCNRHAIDGDCLASETGSFTTLSLTTFAADVQAPINADGSSTFNANRGVVPLRFSLALDGTPTCELPPATLRLARTGGNSPGPIDEGVYSGPSDSGSEFRIADCQYHYNANARALGSGTYLAETLIDGAVVGEARFELK